MDAHVFRRLAAELAPLLTGAVLGKIYNLADHSSLLVLTPQNAAKIYLVLHYGRDNPAVFAVPEKPVAPAQPDAPTMRLRKYLQGKRIRKVQADWLNRVLAFDFSGPQTGLFLTLELAPPSGRPGASLHPALPPSFGQEPAWPEPHAVAEIIEREQAWRDYPVLTPLLRKTLPWLDPREQAALLADLRSGNGDMFVYEQKQPSPGASRAAPPLLAAWPLPAALRAGRAEQVFSEALAAARHCYAWSAMDNHNLPGEALARQAEARRRKRLRRLEAKLDAEEAKLQDWCAGKADALLLQANLHQWDKNHKAASVCLSGPQGQRRIDLNPLLTVRENMERFFHLAARGTRGLAHLALRRNELQTGQEDFPDAKLAAAAPKPGPDRSRPKNISWFKSSQGFLIMRGRNAAGNRDLLKLAAKHDYWFHAKDGPSAHAVLRRSHSLEEVPEQSLQEAAGLAALKSVWKNDSKAEITMALVRDVRPLKGGPPGAVLVAETQAVLVVSPDPELESRLAL